MVALLHDFKHVHNHACSLRGQEICGLVLALKRLGYTQPKLVQGVFYYLAEKVGGAAGPGSSCLLQR